MGNVEWRATAIAEELGQTSRFSWAVEYRSSLLWSLDHGFGMTVILEDVGVLATCKMDDTSVAHLDDMQDVRLSSGGGGSQVYAGVGRKSLLRSEAIQSAWNSASAVMPPPPLFNAATRKLLHNGVDVPAAFYRIILDEEDGRPRVLAFLTPQTVTGHEPLKQFLTSVREVEQRTGLDFYPELAREVQDRIENVKAERLW